MKKYELTTNTKMCFGRKLYQIKALKDFGDVKAGDLGGYIEKEENLSHDGIAWVFGNAYVYGNARVYDDAYVYGNTLISGNAQVFGNARVYDDAYVYGNTYVFGDAKVFGNTCVFDNAQVFGDACVYDTTWIHCDAQISSNADYICFKGFGSKNRNTTMFRTKNGDVYVSCGCFTGSLRAFTDKVKETHGNTKYAKEYLACIKVAKIHFEIDE